MLTNANRAQTLVPSWFCPKVQKWFKKTIDIPHDLVNDKCMMCGQPHTTQTEGTINMNRTDINRALAKAMAYKQCGKEDEARAWAVVLLQELECADIIDPEWMKQ